MIKLNLGCGDVYLEEWINIDLDSSKADINQDLRSPLPYTDNTVDFIINEHFIEHLTVEEGLKFLEECFRVLKPGGVFRIATPDLTYTLFRYFFFWKKQDWIKKYRYEWLKTKGEMINLCFHEWGHKYLYDREELIKRLKEAGFKKIKRVKFGKSSYNELKNKETRKESRLILESIK